MDELDATAFEASPYGFGHRTDNFAGSAPKPLDSRLGVEFKPYTIDISLAKSRDVQCRLTQSLRRDAGIAYRDTPRGGRAFHDTDAFSEVSGLGGGLLARRAGADYDEVEAFIHRFPQAADVFRPEDNQPYTPLGDPPQEL